MSPKKEQADTIEEGYDEDEQQARGKEERSKGKRSSCIGVWYDDCSEEGDGKKEQKGQEDEGGTEEVED